MAGERWLCGVAAAVLALGGGAVRADIVNGDFSQKFTGWDLQVINPSNAPSLALEDANSGRLRLMTSNTWNWNGSTEQWELQETDASMVMVTQAVPADGGGFYAPPGTTAVEFEAAITISNNPAGNTGAGVAFQVNYNGKSAPPGGGLMLDTAGIVHVEMEDLIPNVPVMDFSLTCLSWLNVSPDPTARSSYTITVNAYFDNFKFVPEPISAFLLLAGAAGLVARRGPRRA